MSTAPDPRSNDKARRRRILELVFMAIAVVAALGALLAPPFSQPVSYNDFGDKRPLFGVPNAADVLSNVPFFLIALWGLWEAIRPRPDPYDTPLQYGFERWPFVLAFVAFAATAFGSAYYHLAPDNFRLFWDRLPLTIVVVSIVAIVRDDRLGAGRGARYLLPYVLIGLLSIWHWRQTNAAGRDDMTPYLIVQIACALLIVVLIAFGPPRYTHGRQLWYVVAWYAAAKALELRDKEVFDALGGLISGHTLKHLASAGAMAHLAYWLRVRR